jgi:hypothetical protein
VWSGVLPDGGGRVHCDCTAGTVPRPAEIANVLRPIDSASQVVAVDAVNLTASEIASDRLALVTLQQVVDVPIYTFQDADGRQTAMRADTAQRFAIGDRWIGRVVSTFVGEQVAISDVRYLREYDEYYYGRNDRNPPLPAYRVSVDTDEDPLISGRDDTYRRRQSDARVPHSSLVVDWTTYLGLAVSHTASGSLGTQWLSSLPLEDSA